MKCPMCGNHELVAQSLEDVFGGVPDTFCPEVIKISGKLFNHYRTSPYRTRMIVLPYRILTQNGKSKVSIQSKYKSGKEYFKTLFTVPELHPDTEQKLKDRIKLLLLLS